MSLRQVTGQDIECLIAPNRDTVHLASWELNGLFKEVRRASILAGMVMLYSLEYSCRVGLKCGI